ncbi:cytochrome c oxidase subunit 7B, mitochondrial [Aulostomus maculatus]
MYRFAKSVVNITGQAVRQVRHGSSVKKDFHYKYGNGLLVGGFVFCVGIWSLVLSQSDITWNLSPVGRITPKPWRQPEEEEE